MRRSLRVLGIPLLLAVLAALVIASVLFGSRSVPLDEIWPSFTTGMAEIWAALLDLRMPEITKDTDVDGIVWDLRVPRTLLGLTAGLAIGAAGAITQGHTRNPIADPGILGVNAGAACSVVAGIYVLGISSPIAFMFFGLIGAIIAATVVFGLSALSGSSPLTLVLAGTGLTAMLTAITSSIVLVDTNSLDQWRFWSVGSTAGRGIDVFWASLPFILIGLVLALASGFFLNVLSLGDDMTKALGSRVILIRVLGILTITLLIGAATAACGPIVFLGLVVPHVARAFVGADYRWIIPYSALFGGILLVGCDILGRIVARPGEVQVGVMLALVGAPFLILMVRRQRLGTV
ncbi:iron chelate uptake ABC transporter family permease subunit [Gordonia sp. zg691]|uniref:Iron chelate uptake ABC transporter family permease subunit n=1 Tax=Gordonia jinghuaiqii TaxID=2758710 RepID=A0A7D7LX85_9ACTN|nr:iron chelate uptake ABC transporter family permease subunit [Gordonia jinghuaiqii]MBD0863423.1 iron chelate uptake ABC transporter family permease subunit [Gordonia jinghuaiqii]MCR5979155.1 iron chelate uptake ABC transporter family permease subunit [Gordonia jinghuaiqii]QMT00954.1 iron chelate uptake ABC transporter family permease subunit [Gordonia jinghuaiqii]